MKILIWSLKGGVGKTSIALNLALSCKYKIITNERYSLLPNILNEEELLQLQINEKLPQFKKEDKIIFDMGGTIDKRIVDCLQLIDFILVPTTANDIDIQGCISTLIELQEYVKEDKIIIIANNIVHPKDSKKIKNIVDQISTHKHFEIKRSRGMVNIFSEKKSISDLIKDNGLNKRYYKIINEQFNNLINFIGIENGNRYK